MAREELVIWNLSQLPSQLRRGMVSYCHLGRHSSIYTRNDHMSHDLITMFHTIIVTYSIIGGGRPPCQMTSNNITLLFPWRSTMHLTGLIFLPANNSTVKRFRTKVVINGLNIFDPIWSYPTTFKNFQSETDLMIRSDPITRQTHESIIYERISESTLLRQNLLILNSEHNTTLQLAGLIPRDEKRKIAR